MNATEKTITLFGTEYQVADEHDGLITIKELKSFLPEMERELFEPLKEDIRQNGMHDPILFKEIPEVGNLVLEGHTRLQASIELELTGEEEIPRKAVQEEFNSINEIKLWMLRHQIQRRNLSDVKKLQLALSYKDTIVARAKENLSKAGQGISVDEPVDTAQEMANLAGVSRTTATRFMTVVDKAHFTVRRRLYDGEISIFEAYKKVDTSQRRHIDVPSLKVVESYDEGIKMLNESKITSLVILKDENSLKTFMPYQKKDFGFLFLKD